MFSKLVAIWCGCRSENRKSGKQYLEVLSCREIKRKMSHTSHVTLIFGAGVRAGKVESKILRYFHAGK